ncbi:MAG: HTTM domain-containing protein [Planctomycetales bacterium]
MVLAKQQLRWQIEPTGEFPVPLACLYSPEDLQKKGLNEGLLRDLVRATIEARPGLQGSLTQQDLDDLFAGHYAFQTVQISSGHQEIMIRSPEFVRQYAHEVARVLKAVTGDDVEIYANLEMSVNYRPYEVCVPNSVDLVKVESASDLWPSIRSLKEKLPAAETRLATAQQAKALRELDEELELRTLGLKRPPEPLKAPGLGPEEEQFLQAYFPDPAK